MRVSSRPSQAASRATVVSWLKAVASPPVASWSDGIPTASPPSTDSAALVPVIVASALLTGYSLASGNLCETTQHRYNPDLRTTSRVQDLCCGTLLARLPRADVVGGARDDVVKVGRGSGGESV